MMKTMKMMKKEEENRAMRRCSPGVLWAVVAMLDAGRFSKPSCQHPCGLSFRWSQARGLISHVRNWKGLGKTRLYGLRQRENLRKPCFVPSDIL